MYTQHINEQNNVTKEPILSIWRKIQERENLQQHMSDSTDSNDESDKDTPSSYVN